MSSRRFDPAWLDPARRRAPYPRSLRQPRRQLENHVDSYFQSSQIGNAGSHGIQVQFDEIILYATRLGGVKDLSPIQVALSQGDSLLGRCRPILRMHGYKPAGITGEILGRIVAAADSRDLELEGNELRIEKIEQQIVSTRAVNGRQLEIFVVKAQQD